MSKAIKYALISVVMLSLAIFLFLGAVFFWISSEVPKTFGYFNTSIHFPSTNITQLENTKLHYKRDGKLYFQTSISIANANDKKIFVRISDLDVNLDFSKLFKNLTIPVNVLISGLDINLNNTSTDKNFVPNANDSNKAFNGTNIFKKIRQISSFVNPNSFIHLNRIQIHNSHITRGDFTYELSQDSGYENDIYNITTTIKTNNSYAKIEINSSDTKNDSSLDLKASDLPVWLFTKKIPVQYSSPVLDSINKDFMLSMNLNYKHNKKNSSDSISLGITGKDLNSTNQIKKLSLAVSNKYDPAKIQLEDSYISFSNDRGYVSITGEISHDHGLISGKSRGDIVIIGDNIHFAALGSIWPYGIEKSTRDWLISSIQTGEIHDLHLKINLESLANFAKDSLQGHFRFSKVNLKYHDEFEIITNIRGTANADLEAISLRIDEADLIESKLSDSSVKVIYSEKLIPLIIGVNADGKVKDFIHFMGEKKIKNFTDKGIDVRDAGGILTGKVHVEIPLAQKINLDSMKINASADIHNLDIKFSDILRIKSGELDLKVTNKLISLIGRSLINDQQSRFEWTSYLKEQNQYFDNRLVINGYVGKDAEFEKLFAGKFDIEEGEILTNFMFMNKGEVEKIIIQFDLDEAKYSIPDIGIVKEKGVSSAFNFEMLKEDEGNWKTSKFDLVAPDINIQSNMELTKNFDLVNFHSDVKYSGNNFTANIAASEDKIDIKIHGPHVKFDHANLLNLFNIGVYKQYIEEHNKKKSKKDRMVFLSIQIDDAIMKNDVKFTNIVGNFECHKRQCINSGLSMNINEKYKLKAILRNENNTNKWIITATHAADFLRAFDIYRDIKGGTLYAEISSVTKEHVTSAPGNIFVGHVKIDNFAAVKTPVIANLLLASPFQALINASKAADLMSFDTLEANFVFTFLTNTLKVNRTYAKGVLLSVTGDGYVDIKNDKMNIHGLLIPHYKINDIATSFSAAGTPTGVIATNYSIIGDTKKPEIYVSPIGIMLSVLLKLPGFGFVI